MASVVDENAEVQLLLRDLSTEAARLRGMPDDDLNGVPTEMGISYPPVHMTKLGRQLAITNTLIKLQQAHASSAIAWMKAAGERGAEQFMKTLAEVRVGVMLKRLAETGQSMSPQQLQEMTDQELEIVERKVRGEANDPE